MGRPLGSKNKNHTADGEALRNSDSVDGAELRALIERVEDINATIADYTGDRSELFKEIKAAGYDTGVVRGIIKRRAMNPEKRINMESLMDEYMAALGDFATTELGQAGADRIRGEVRV